MTKEEREEKARNITESRILTQDDFAKIKRAQIAKKVGIKEKRGLKRKAGSTDVVSVENEERGYVADLIVMRKSYPGL